MAQEKLVLGFDVGGTKIGVAEPTYVVEKCTDSATGAVLTVFSVDATGALMCQPKVDLNKYPVMRWKWRAITLPKGADGRDPRKDDQAMVLYQNWAAAHSTLQVAIQHLKVPLK